jgi:3-hydroxyisobutyrate dehydrogenase-like beta-hydroxyacid dehydrogenase
MGQVVKVVNNYINLNNLFIISEALVLGVKCGMKPERLIELLNLTSAKSWYLKEYLGPRVLSGDFSPTFSLNLAIKDIGLAMKTADELKVPLPMGGLCYQLARSESARGKAALDAAAIVTGYEEMAGVRVRKESQ